MRFGFSRRLVAFVGVVAVAIVYRILLSYFVAPLSDIYYYDTQAVSALLGGIDPYGHLYTGIPPALMTAGAQTVFAYLPGVFLILVPFAPFDVRVAIAACELVVAWAIFALGGRWSLLAAAFFLLFPFSPLFSMVYVNNALPAMVFLGLGVLLERRERKTSGAAMLGLAAASSEFMLLILPFFLLLWFRRRGWKEIVVGLGTAAAVTLPFLAWNPGSFVQNTIYFEFSRPVYPFISNAAPWGLNLNPSLSGFAVSLTGSAAPPLLRGALALAALAAFLWRSADLRSTLTMGGSFVAVGMFILPGDFFWTYLELPFQILLMVVALDPPRGRPQPLNA